MLFHTHFVLSAFIGWTTGWKSPPRADNETTWLEAMHRHGLGTVLGILWSIVVYQLSPTYFWWWLPITGSLALSVPISVISSHATLGSYLRKLGLFVIPEEIAPPPELIATTQYVQAAAALPGFVDAVVNPSCNALLCTHGKAHPYMPRNSQRKRSDFVNHALKNGPAALTAQDKLNLLDDPLLLSQLHLEVWRSKDAHPDWCLNETSKQSPQQRQIRYETS
jgi:membrane glycosyltransferase